MPAHIDYSSGSEEEEMTPNKGSHISCGSNGGEVKLSLCYSYRQAVDSFSGWPSAVVKSKENHSLSQDLIQGQNHFLCNLGIYALQQSGGLSRLCHCLKQLTSYSWSCGNLIVTPELFIVIWPSQAGFTSSIAVQNQASSATSHHFGHSYSELSSLCVSLFLAVTWNQADFLLLFHNKHQLERGLCQSQRAVMLLRISELHIVLLLGLPQTHCLPFKIKIHLWCLGSSCQRTWAVLFSNL